MAVAALSAGTLYLTRHQTPASQAAAPAAAPVAVVHYGPAVLQQVSLHGGPAGPALQLPGTPDEIITTPDRSKAFLLDPEHGDVVPVDLAHDRLGPSIAVGRLPVDEHLSADGSTLYVTDNLGQSVIPIDTATLESRPPVSVPQGADLYVPSPDGSQALVGMYTASGQPGLVFLTSPTTGLGAPLAAGQNAVQYAFYSRDGRTVWVGEQGLGNQPSILFPIDTSTRKEGRPITLGHAASSAAVTPDGRLAVVTNTLDGTVSVVDLSARLLLASVPVGAEPQGVEITPDGHTAWVACVLDRTLVPVDLTALHAGKPVTLGNAPTDLSLSSAAEGWALFPSSPGDVTFLRGDSTLGEAIRVGNGPNLVIAHDGRDAWIANGLSDTVQRIDLANQTAGPAIHVPQDPTQALLTPDGRTLLVLSFGNGAQTGSLTAINTATSSASPPLAVGAAPSSLTLSPNGTTAFVANHQANSIAVIDVTHMRVTQHLALPCSPTSLQITPGGRKLYAACESNALVVPITLASLTPGTAIPVINNPRIIMDSRGTALYVLAAHAIQEIDTASDSITHSAPETGNVFDAVPAPNDHTLLALDNAGGNLLQIDPRTLVTTRSLALGSRPDSLELSPDGTRAYVLDSTEQKLYVVNVPAWSVVATVSVSPDAAAVVTPASVP